MSLRAYSRRRGCTLRAVQVAILSGRLTAASVGRDERGRPFISSADVADREWASATRAERVPITGRTAPRRSTRSDAGAPAASPLSLVRVRLDSARAEMAELDFLERAGRLVDAQATQLEAVEMVTTAREAILSVPSKFKALVPHLSHGEVAQLHGLLERALEVIADRPGRSNGGVA